MDDLGIPPSLVITADERRAAWKGKKLKSTAAMTFAVPKKDEDAATKQLRKELEAAEAKKKAERFARLKQLKESKSMTKKIAKKATPTPKAKVAKTKNLGTKRAAAKTAAQNKARSPVAELGGRKAQVTEMMKRPEGVTVAQIQEATGMLPHSARALITGIAKVEKIDRAKKDGGPTVYTIA
jgi:hypothetical protein